MLCHFVLRLSVSILYHSCQPSSFTLLIYKQNSLAPSYLISSKLKGMFADFYTADRIAAICAEIDMECRLDFSKNYIVDERNYVSTLTDRIRRELRNFHLRCHSQVAPKNFEEKHGVDGIMIFQSGNRVKVGLFEAKRPQVLKNNYHWDYLSSRKISHFSEQIEKQRIWKDQLALWEMFINEKKPSTIDPPYDSFGSSCFWNDNAYSFMHKEKLILKPWDTNKLKELLSTSGVNFYSIIYDILSCRVGQVYEVDQYGQFCNIQSQSNPDEEMNIPLPAQNPAELEQAVEAFLNQNNIGSLLHINIQPIFPSYPSANESGNELHSEDDDLPF